MCLALVLNNLANLYHNQKKYAQAEPLYRQALAIREAQLSPTHLKEDFFNTFVRLYDALDAVPNR